MSYTHSYGGSISSVRFNQDHGLFSCAMDSGVRIYNVEPLAEKRHLDTSIVGSVAFCEILYRTNMLAIVGGGRKQKFAENAVLVWDDHLKQFVSEFTFSSPVLSIRLRRDMLFVAQRHKIHVFSFPDNPVKLFTFNSGENPKGLCEVSPFPSSERQLLLFPGEKQGSLEIVDLAKITPGSSAAPMNIPAHKHPLACIALNHQGTYVASASVNGTLIRVYDTYNHQTPLITLRRGTDHAAFYCINFSSDSEYLCASSDKGTIHIFALKNTGLNRKMAYFIQKAANAVGSEGNSQYSFATFSVTQECKCICAFGSNSSIYAICVDGTFHKYVYTNEGNCNRESYDVFLNLCDDDDF